jgi:hypothetical protein
MRSKYEALARKLMNLGLEEQVDALIEFHDENDSPTSDRLRHDLQVAERKIEALDLRAQRVGFDLNRFYGMDEARNDYASNLENLLMRYENALDDAHEALEAMGT